MVFLSKIFKPKSSKGCNKLLPTFSGAQLTTSKQGKPNIVMAGYRFCKKQVLGLKTHWQCATNRGCHAVLHTLDDMTLIKVHNVHNHDRILKRNT